jgi:DDE superfamily endonuclease
MEVRDATRQQPWLAACPVAPESFEQVRPRLATFLVPCGETCCRQARPQPAPPSLGGLLAEVARTKVAASASRFGQDRLPLPRCMGWAPWEAGPVRQELTRQVAAPLGPAAGGWVFDPAGCPTSGPASGGGVARQWGGRRGQVDPGQVARSWGSGSGVGPARVDRRLSVPNAWPTDQARLATAGGPTPTAGLARGTRGRGPGGRPVAGGVRLGGALARTRGGVRLGVGAGVRAGARARCGRCRATRGGTPGRPPSRRSTGGGGVRRVPGHASTRGGPRWPRAPGSGAPCATAPKGRWWSTWSHAGWWHGRPGGNQAMRSDAACDATATTRRSCRWIFRCPTPSLRPRGGSWPAEPKPNRASQKVSSAARGQPVAQTMQSVMGRGGSSSTRCRYSPQGCW